MPENSQPHARHDWHDESLGNASIAGRHLARRRRLLQLAMLLLALTGALAGSLAWVAPEPQPYFVPLWVTDFRSPQIPNNIAADHDRRALRDGGYFTRSSSAPLASLQGHQLLEEVIALKQRAAGDSVVVYLSTYAGYAEPGGVFLVPGDYDPDDPGGRVPLRKVLQSLAQCPAQHKLLVLDIIWPVADTRLGLLTDQVGTQLPAELRQVPDTDRTVLCSCQAGQTALVSAELGRSLFGYYFEQALAGHADGYNPQRRSDGRVSVGELAAFTGARVQRFCVQNRLRRQAPVLLAEGQDFDLASVHRARVARMPELPPPRKYPKWLKTAWQQRDHWQQQRYQINPRCLAQLEGALLRAERQWLARGDLARIEMALEHELTQLQRKLAESEQAVPGLAPRSLAQAWEAGQRPNPLVTKALEQLLAKLDLAPPETALKAAAAELDKLQANLTKQKQKIAPFDLAWTVFHHAIVHGEADPLRLQALRQLLAGQPAAPDYAETLLLSQLAQVAAQTTRARWPEPLVARALQTFWHGEQSMASFRVLPWTSSVLDQAFQSRHNALTALLAIGSAPPEYAEAQIHRAERGFRTVLACRDRIEAAEQTLDQAYAVLPDYPLYLAYDLRYDDVWHRAVDATCQLAQALQPAPGETPPEQDEEQLRPRIELIGRQTAMLQRSLGILLAPMQSASIDLVLAECQRADATPAPLEEVHARLITPLVSAENRVRLFTAWQELSRRLVQTTLNLDTKDNLSGEPTSGPVCNPDRPAVQQHCQKWSERRRAWSLALLKLGGARDIPAENASATELRRAWAVQLPRQLRSAKHVAEQDRLSRIYLPFDPSTLLDTPDTNPTVRLRLARTRRWWTWLAEHYRYLARDTGLSFYADAAAEFGQQVTLPTEQFVSIDGPASLQSLTISHPEAAAAFRWQLIGAGAKHRSKVSLKLLVPGPQQPISRHALASGSGDSLNSPVPDSQQLQVTAGDQATLASPVQVQVRWQPGRAALASTATEASGSSTSSAAAKLVLDRLASLKGNRPPANELPTGFLLQWQVGGRSFHRRVSLPGLADAVPLRIALSSNPQHPTPDHDVLRLRPAAAWQPFYLYITNPTSASLNLVVELQGATTATAKLPLAGGGTQRVQFQGEAPKKGVPLPPLAGPLLIRVLDDKQQLLAERRIAVEIAQPRQYVTVRQIRFDPSSPVNNRFYARLAGIDMPPGPPCTVQLVLPKTQIPGLMGIGGGTLSGVVPADGSELELTAENLQLSEGQSEQGTAYFNIDGLARALAFRTTFARQGSPTTPQEDLRPALRFSAPELAHTGADFALSVEADYAPADAHLLVSIGQGQRTANQNGPPDAGWLLVKRLPTPKQQRVGISPFGPKGALLLEAAIGDWSVAVDTSGLIGDYTLRAELIGHDGQSLATATRPVVFDDTPPDAAHWVTLPSEAVPSKPVTLEASASDNLSGIQNVRFFLGAVKDGQPPQGSQPVEAAPLKEDPTNWSAQLPLTKAEFGPNTVTAEFVNGVGLSTFISGTIEVVEKETVPPASISGVVLEGPRPQAKLIVTLSDAKGKAQAKATTDAKGSFHFPKLAPGSYTVQTEKASSQRKGSAQVTVQPGQAATVTIHLSI